MIHDINGNISTDLDPQTLCKKPRPLSIIGESSIDATKNGVNDSNRDASIDSHSVRTGRPTRRLAVAPLQHPVIELSLAENLPSVSKDVKEAQNIWSLMVGDRESWKSLNDQGLGVLNWSIPDKSYDVQRYTLSDPDDGKCLVTNGPKEPKSFSYESSDQWDEHLAGRSKAKHEDPRESTPVCDTEIISPGYDSNDEVSTMKKLRKFVFPSAESKNVSKLDDIREEKQLAPKRDLDKDQTAWRERVRESVSVTSLPDKFRPLRKSLGSLSSGSFNPGSDVSHRRDKHSFDASGQETFRFYPPGQRSAPEYLINPNSVVTRHPSQLKDCQGPIKLKDVIQRQSFWQGSQNSHAQKNEDIDTKRKEYLSQFTSAKPVIEIEQLNETDPTEKLDQDSSAESQIRDTESVRLASVPENAQTIQAPTRRISTIDQSHYVALKETTNRLRLSTRRASTLAWKAQYADHTGEDQAAMRLRVKNVSFPQDDGPLTKERIDRVEQSLAMLRNELISIRHQDQDLAKQFLTIRHNMGKLRWAMQCKTHDELLEEAEDEIQDYHDMSRLVDLPSPTVDLISSVTFLQHFGVTRMNISSRRFSTC